MSPSQHSLEKEDEPFKLHSNQIDQWLSFSHHFIKHPCSPEQVSAWDFLPSFSTSLNFLFGSQTVPHIVPSHSPWKV